MDEVLSHWDVELLARHICGADMDNESVDVDEILDDKFGIEFDQFLQVVRELLPLCTVGTSPLTEKTYRGFASDNCFIVKIDA